MSRHEQLSVGELTLDDTIITATPAQLNYGIFNASAQYKMVTGSLTLTSASAKNLATLGLSTVVNAVVTSYLATAPTAKKFTYYVSGASITFYAWKATSGTNTVLVAGDTAEAVKYTLFGVAA